MSQDGHVCPVDPIGQIKAITGQLIKEVNDKDTKELIQEQVDGALNSSIPQDIALSKIQAALKQSQSGGSKKQSGGIIGYLFMGLASLLGCAIQQASSTESGPGRRRKSPVLYDGDDDDPHKGFVVTQIHKNPRNASKVHPAPHVQYPSQPGVLYRPPQPYQPQPYQPAPYQPAPYQPSPYQPSPYQPRQQAWRGGGNKRVPYEKRTKPDLVEVAKSRKIKYSGMSKVELIAALRKHY